MSFNFSDLTNLLKELTNVKDIFSHSNDDAAHKIEDDIVNNFNNSCDPNKNTWAPNKTNTKTLIATGEMLSSLSVAINNNTIIFNMDMPANYHQFGTRNMTIRQIFPNADEIPDSWRQILDEIHKKNMETHFGNRK